MAGLRVIELAGLGPGPFCAMVLADLGAEVIRLERTGIPASVVGAVDRRMVLTRGRHAIGVDLKRQRGVELVLDMVEHADVLLEGFRPGVVERIGLGPSVCLQRNPRLIYGRITGYGREGPLAAEAGHDINYISVAGALAPIGRRGEAPVPPLNLVADFGGGGMLLAMGILAAVYERTRSGLGQVVDAAMVDGAALLTTMFHQIRGLSLWHDERGTNSMDTGSHYYNVYETSDGEFLSVGAMEPRFYRSFMKGLGFSEEDIPPQDDQTQWESLTSRVAQILRSRTRVEWLETFLGTDACVTPVLSLGEAPTHPHNRARATFVDVGGTVEPAPAPRFSRTPPRHPSPPPGPGVHATQELVRWGLAPDQIDLLVEEGVVD
ncbi:MAG: CaiB/BaiF CoA-transferase family protein [Acidimicrobiales bacterium]